MPTTFANLWEGNEETIASTSTISYSFLVEIDPSQEVADVEENVIYALAGAQPEWFSKYGRTFYRSEISVSEHIAFKKWRANVVWTTKEKEKPPVEDSAPEIAMSSGGGAQHVTQSLVTTAKYPTNAIDYNAIGFDGKTVQGVDIMVPNIEFSETYTRDQSWMDYDIIRALTTKSGRVLNQDFRGFPIGEVMYKGCDISRPADGSGKVKFTYHFAVSPNRTNIAIGDLTVTAKKGWEYLWIRYADEYDNTAKEVLKKPIAAYVETMYEWVSMADIYLTAESAWVYPPSGGPA
jgi:hypothetical protein